MSALLDLFRQANHLKSLPRTGWLFAGVAQPESLADHTCLVALYALFLAQEINRDPQAQGLDAPLNVERVLALALLHDLAECVLTDLPKRSTDALGSQAKHAAEAAIVDDLLADVAGGAGLVKLWQEYDGAATPEARLIKDVDKLEMVYQSICYSRRGHTTTDEFRAGHTWRYPISHRLFDEMIAELSP